MSTVDQAAVAAAAAAAHGHTPNHHGNHDSHTCSTSRECEGRASFAALRNNTNKIANPTTTTNSSSTNSSSTNSNHTNTNIQTDNDKSHQHQP